MYIPRILVCHEKKVSSLTCTLHGFTLIEVLLVMGLMLVLGVAAYPMSISFFTAQLLDDTTNEFTSVLRSAQNNAITQKHDSAFGVKILPSSYVLFEGSTYVSRTESEDEVFALPSSALISGIDEIVFAKHTGIPTSVASITLSIQNETSAITISAKGAIE